MPNNAIIFGALLTLLGPIFYLQGGTHASPTAFIPSIFGVLIAVMGILAKNPARRKATMHGAAGVALLGLLGSLRGLSAWPSILLGKTQGFTQSKLLSSWSTLLMFVLCLAFLVLCIKWFRDSRRAPSPTLA